MIDDETIKANAWEIAVAVAKNCGSVPNLTFHDIYFGLKDFAALAFAPAQPVAMTDEREAFEAVARKEGFLESRFSRVGDGYANREVLRAWRFWQARAALSARAAQKVQHRFENVTCSQCGQDFGAGDSGFSHCKQHRSDALSASETQAVPIMQFEKDSPYEFSKEVRDAVLGTPQLPAPREQQTVMFNGLTEAETCVTASVAGLEPAAPSEQRKPLTQAEEATLESVTHPLNRVLDDQLKRPRGIRSTGGDHV